MRVFVPMTAGALRGMLESGGLGPPPIVGYAVTAHLRESYADGDDEELEYVAMTLAARACLDLLAAQPEAEGTDTARRMVLVVDTEDVTPDDGTRGAVVVDAAIAIRQVAALHADTEDAQEDVEAAVAVVRAGGPRDPDEQFVVDSCEAHELAWYATQEFPDLV